MKSPLSDELTQELAQQQVERFVARFERNYRYLACHCALPLVLTPELVNYIRVQFLLNEEVPWIAEADLLLSELCRPVGYELYAMSPAVRSNLLAQFQEPEFQQKFGANRLKSVAQLLMDYVTYLMRTHPTSRQVELQAQRWAAMVYLDEHRTQVEEEIAKALQALVSRGKNGQSELARLQRLIEEFRPQLSQYDSLRQFAKELSIWLKDRIPPDAGRAYAVHGVRLHLSTRNYAIAIGINQYRDSRLPPSQYAVTDAAVMQQWFSQRGFERVHLLTDVSRPNISESPSPPSQAQWQQFWQANFSQAALSAEDCFWFYFSGYSVNRQGQDYLFLADSDLDNLDETGLSLTNLVKLLFFSGVGKVILLLDVDRSFSAEEVSSLEQQLSQELNNECGLIIISASSPKQEAYEIDVLQQGTFTYALQEALWSTQGNISIESLTRFLRERIPELNEQYNRPRQTPESFILPTHLREWIPFPSNLQVFEFKTLTVNRRGEIIKEDTKLAQYYTEDLGNDIKLDLVAVSSGTFLMGTEAEEIERLVKKFGWEEYRREKPQHEVTIQPFFMGKYPVTQSQWRAIAQRTDLQVERDLTIDPSHFNGDELPVEQVNWYDAVEFCARLSKLTKKGYRLPSEAEWEYACRAGTTTPFSFGETITGKLANYDARNTYADEPKGKYQGETTPVGQFPPNAFGLYDMHGQVWEWCADDWHDNSYNGAPTDGSAWLTGDKDTTKILRGGSCINNPDNCRSANRCNYGRDLHNPDIGVRVVCGGGRTV